MQLLQAENQDQFDKILEECEWRFEIQGLPPVIPLKHRNVFIDEVVQYYVLVQCKAMPDQLLLGLNYYQVLLHVVIGISITMCSVMRLTVSIMGEGILYIFLCTV